MKSKWLAGDPERKNSPGQYLALTTLCAATVLMIPLQRMLPGLVVWAVSVLFTFREPDARFRLRMGVLLGCAFLLAYTPINTDTSNGHFISLGVRFLLAVVGPALILGFFDPGVIRYRFWPKKFRKLDFFYVLISIPLAWAVINFYFFHANPELPTHWLMPVEPEKDAITRLFVGINCVGIWDELFFVNTVYAVMRSLFSFRVANLAQAVIYMAILNKMAFTGIGPVVVYLFALTQGAMFEESENLLYVLIVHLIVDAFLVGAILHYYYPGYSSGWF
ncbi:MAG: hypothetical protein GY835_26490 [bacterium]|nr:hypothetical protein [bacterium]